MKKIAYIIPGYSESHLQQRSYNNIAKFFDEYGIEPIHVNIDWKEKDKKMFSDYAKQFLKVYKRPKKTEVYILGFSYGAIVAFLTAAKTKPKALILCSLSPYFQEDLRVLNPTWVKWFRKNFIKSDLSFTNLASKIQSETYLIVGQMEDKVCLVRARDAKRKIPHSHISIIKGAKHNIGQKEYLEALKTKISRL